MKQPNSLAELSGLTNISIQDRINDINVQNQAETRRSSDLRPRMALRLTIQLDTAATAQNPFIIPNPFNGVYVEAAYASSTPTVADSTVNVQLGLGGLDKYVTDNYTSLFLNASFKADTTVKQAVLTWSAQAGKVIVLVFYLGIDFRPGSQVSIINGSISIIGGSAIATGTLGSGANQNNLSVTNAAAVQLCAVNASRKSFNFYTTSDIWVGDSSVAVNRGTKIFAGSQFFYQNTGTLYAIADVATSTVSGSEES